MTSNFADVSIFLQKMTHSFVKHSYNLIRYNFFSDKDFSVLFYYTDRSAVENNVYKKFFAIFSSKSNFFGAPKLSKFLKYRKFFYKAVSQFTSKNMAFIKIKSRNISQFPEIQWKN